MKSDEDDEKCLVCGHLDSEHASPERQVEGMWPCEVLGCTCMDIITQSGIDKIT